jgi:NAD(P)-dependent dehydrogenase (short-subunit alcohol dehydrogenase family)
VDGRDYMNRIVLITGSTRGIGFATALEFLKDGDQVAIFCRHQGHVREAVKHLGRLADSQKVLGLVGDVRKGVDVKRIVNRCLKTFGRIDVLVNNAGTAACQEIEKTTEKQWDEILDTNLKGTFLFLREVLPAMKERRSGIIVNVSSLLGIEGMKKLSAYCASKFGVIGLTRSVADETVADGVRVYAVLPGAVDTKLNKDLDLDLKFSDLSRPEDVASRIFQLAEGKKKSGQSVKVYQ